MGVNKIPFTGIYGISSLSDGSNLASAILAGATPLSAQALAGGYSGIFYITVGGATTILSLFSGPPPVDSIQKNSMWVVEFGADDGSGNELTVDVNTFVGTIENSGGQNLGTILANKRYLFDTTSICELVIVNSLLNSRLSIKVWELYQA